jgi:hypothetical protein
MEAHGHEEIINKSKDLLKEKLEELGLKQGVDFDVNSLYIGNWIADLSQITDEALKFPIYKFLNYPEELYKLLPKILEVIRSFDIYKAIFVIIDEHKKKRICRRN